MIQADAVASAIEFPGSIEIAILVAFVSGAVGAFAADLATDAGKLERFKPDDAGWSLGFIGKIIVGAVAAVALLTLNPPGDSWPTLIGTALVAGFGGDAIVVSFVATGQVNADEQVLRATVSQLNEVSSTAVQRSAGTEALQVVQEKINTVKAGLESFLKR